MRYAEYSPPPNLATLVERFWLLEGAAQSTGSADAVIPDGRVELIFHYGGPFWRHSASGDAVKQPVSLLVGQMIEPVVLAPDGPAGVDAARLFPSRSVRAFPRPRLDLSVGQAPLRAPGRRIERCGEDPGAGGLADGDGLSAATEAC